MMNYIYDILINFNYNLYDFYDWHREDNILNVKSILIYKISSENLNKMRNNIIKVDNNFLEKIADKTEYFDKQSINKIKHACLFSDGMDVIGIKFNSQGVSIGISKLLIEEELEILEITDILKGVDINFEILKERNTAIFRTRREIKERNKIINELYNIDDIEKLKYLYFECFNREESKKEIIYRDLIKAIDKDNNLYKIKEILKLVSIKTVY